MKYELLGALWLLGDGRAVPLYVKTLAEADLLWPRKIHHMKKKTYLQNLKARLETLRRAVAASAPPPDQESGKLTRTEESKQ